MADERKADNADKKHDPSEKALREAADRGQLPRSNELHAVTAVVALTSALTFAGGAVAAPILRVATTVLAPGGTGTLDIDDAQVLLAQVAQAVVLAAGPPLLAAGAAALVVGLAQTRFQVAPRALQARLDVLDPLPRIRELFFSRHMWVELVKGLIHVFALGAVAGYAIWERVGELPQTAAESVGDHLALMVDSGSSLIWRALPVMTALAAIDYAFAYFSWWQGLRRTDQQVKEDHKEAEGDPMIRAQRRRRMRDLSSRNAVRQLREATVLVTNPTHYAVGLRYRHGKDGAPIVVVKGADHLALRLRREAFRLGIPRVEDRLLARTLYAKVARGQPIPLDLYAAVAKVLALIYKRRRASLPKRSGAPGRTVRHASRQGEATPLDIPRRGRESGADRLRPGPPGRYSPVA